MLFHNLKLKCIKLDCGWGSAPDPAEEAYSAPKTHKWKGREGEVIGEGRRRGGEGEEGRGKGMKEENLDPMVADAHTQPG